MLRDRSGRISYQILLFVLCLLSVVLSLLQVDKLTILVLAGLLIFHLVCGWAVYYWLDKRL